MEITAHATDAATLSELGQRLRAHRIDRELTQRELGREAGVSVDTVKRVEAGRPVGSDNLLRLLRTLGLLAGLEQAIPMPPPRPLEQLARRGRDRQRVRHAARRPPATTTWTWGDDGGRA